jgi:hypothetical protein
MQAVSCGMLPFSAFWESLQRHSGIIPRSVDRAFPACAVWHHLPICCKNPATQFASAMQEQGDAAGAGPSPASNGPPVVKLAKRNCQPMPATASNNELAVVMPAVEPATANQLGASRGVALPTSQRCCESGVPCCFTMLGTGSMMLVNCTDFLCLCSLQVHPVPA